MDMPVTVRVDYISNDGLWKTKYLIWLQDCSKLQLLHFFVWWQSCIC